MAGPTIEVAPPLRVPREGGLSSVAEFRPNDRLGAAGGLVYQSDGCTFPRSELSRCIAETPPADKTFDGIELEGAIGSPFTLYAGVECYLGPDPDFADRARAILDGGRDRALETELAAWADGATALTPGAGIDGAIAAVDNDLDENYLGRGVILMNRGDAVLAGGALDREGGQIITINGTPVLSSAMVPAGTVYGVGAITVEQSEVVDLEVPAEKTNRMVALAEQMFALIVDCEFRTKAPITAAP